MAGEKQSFLLRPYSHSPTPLDKDDLSRYVEQELIKIASPLNTLTEHYAPNVTVSLSDPQGSLAVSAAPAKVVDYSTALVSRYSEGLGLTLDPLAGDIIFNGEPGGNVTMEMSVFISVGRGTLAQNNSLFLTMTDGITTWSMGSVWIASAQQDILSLGATIMINVATDAVLNCSLFTDGGTGVVNYVNGYFTGQFISGILPTLA